MKTVPDLPYRDRGDKKVGRVLGVKPTDKTGIGARLFRFADRIRVQHEVHNRNGLTKSSGMRGGSQSVVSRTESCQAFNFFIRWRAVPLRHQGRGRRSAAVPLARRPSSQSNNSRAWGADSFLTFLTASSTALMPCTLPRKPFCGKRVLQVVVNKRRRPQFNWIEQLPSKLSILFSGVLSSHPGSTHQWVVEFGVCLNYYEFAWKKCNQYPKRVPAVGSPAVQTSKRVFTYWH